MMGHGHMQRQHFNVRWAESEGPMAAAERDDHANIVDMRSWHEQQVVPVQLTEESSSRLVTGFMTAVGNPIVINEREIFSRLT